MTKKMTKKSDAASDRRIGIREGSAKDKALDAKRGVPEMPKRKTKKAR